MQFRLVSTESINNFDKWIQQFGNVQSCIKVKSNNSYVVIKPSSSCVCFANKTGTFMKTNIDDIPTKSKGSFVCRVQFFSRNNLSYYRLQMLQMYYKTK